MYNINKLPDFYSVRNFEQIDYSLEGMSFKKCFAFFDKNAPERYYNCFLNFLIVCCFLRGVVNTPPEALTFLNRAAGPFGTQSRPSFSYHFARK